MKARVAVLRRWKHEGSLEDILADAGYEVISANDDTFHASGVDVIWAQGNINWYPRARSALKRLGSSKRPAVMIWHSEPLPFPRNSGFPRPTLRLREIAKICLRDQRATDAYTNYFRLKEMHQRQLVDLIVVSARSRQKFLAEKGIPSHFVPLGYHSGLGERLDLERDIDVLFIGTLDDSRHRSALRFLRNNGIAVKAMGSWNPGPTWGTSRTKLINRARIFLNVQRHPGQYSGYRMLLGMANGAMLLSEPMHDPFPYEPAVHYVESPLQQMPETIRKYLSDESARVAIAESGYRFATESLTVEKSMHQMIALMETMLAERS